MKVSVCLLMLFAGLGLASPMLDRPLEPRCVPNGGHCGNSGGGECCGDDICVSVIAAIVDKY
jgi:hypothetical protein